MHSSNVTVRLSLSGSERSVWLPVVLLFQLPLPPLSCPWSFWHFASELERLPILRSDTLLFLFPIFLLLSSPLCFSSSCLGKKEGVFEIRSATFEDTPPTTRRGARCRSFKGRLRRNKDGSGAADWLSFRAGVSTGWYLPTDIEASLSYAIIGLKLFVHESGSASCYENAANFPRSSKLRRSRVSQRYNALHFYFLNRWVFECIIGAFISLHMPNLSVTSYTVLTARYEADRKSVV